MWQRVRAQSKHIAAKCRGSVALPVRTLSVPAPSGSRWAYSFRFKAFLTACHEKAVFVLTACSEDGKMCGPPAKNPIVPAPSGSGRVHSFQPPPRCVCPSGDPWGTPLQSEIRSVFIISNRKISNWASQTLKANMLLICPYCLKFQIARV